MHHRHRPTPRGFPATRPRRRESTAATLASDIWSRTARNDERAFERANLAIASDLDLDSVLQRVVDSARRLVGARYGAISWLDERGHFPDLVVSGLTQDEVRKIGDMPQGHGLLGLVISEGETLRLTNLTRHSHSVGFPDHHPPMRSLLAVPISVPGNILGNLYLSESLYGKSFSRRDEHRLQRFATQAAVALLNARLHRQSYADAIATERERIAREMHDSLAQVLGYAMTKSQAALAHLARDNPDAAVSQIEQLHDAARHAFADVRENITGLRMAACPELDLVTALEDFVTGWQDQSGISTTLNVPSADQRSAIKRHPAATRLQLLRIVQEATTNVRKHAQASAVAVSLGHDGAATRLPIEDNGNGFPPDLSPSQGHPRFGMATMRERAESVGGVFDVRSSSSGTTVRVVLPDNRRSRP